MKTEWTDAQLDAVEAAMIAEGHLEIEAATVRGRLTARKLREDMPVLYDFDGTRCHRTTDLLQRAGQIGENDINVRALITVDEAREITLKAIKGWVNKDDESRVMTAADILFDRYQYGPDHE